MQNRTPEYPDPTQWFAMWQQMYMQWMSLFMPGMPGMWPGGMPATPGVPATPGFGVPATPGFGMLATKDIELALDGRTTKVSFALSRPTLGPAKAELRHDETNDRLTVEVCEQGKLKIQLTAKQPAGHYAGELKDRMGSRYGFVEAVVSE